MAVVQSLSWVLLLANPWTVAHQVFLSFTITQSLLKLIHVHWVSDAFQPSHPLFPPSPPALNLSQPSGIRVFSNKSTLVIRWPKYWSFNFSNSPSNEYSGLISFRIDWFSFSVFQKSFNFEVIPEFREDSLVAQTVKNLPSVWETWVWSLVWEDTLEKGTATYSSILAWRIPWTEGFGRLWSMGWQRVRYGWVTFFFLSFLSLSVTFNLVFIKHFSTRLIEKPSAILDSY